MRKAVLSFLVSAAIAVSSAFVSGGNSGTSATGTAMTTLTTGKTITQKTKTIKVSNARQFMEALGPDRLIVLEAGKYDLSEYDPYLGKNMDKASKLKLAKGISWSQEHDGGQLVLNGIKNLTIRGMGKDRSSEIIVDPRYVFVMQFSNCAGITIEGLTAGHSQGGYCVGGVFSFKGSSVVKINETNMYGCGTYGLELSDVKLMDVTNCQIYECTYGIMTVQGSQDIAFKGCTFRDNQEFSLIEISGTRNMLFENCNFSNNRGSRMFEVSPGAPLFVSDSTFQGNNLESGIQGSNNVQFNAGCTFDETEEAEEAMEEFCGGHKAATAAFSVEHIDYETDVIPKYVLDRGGDWLLFTRDRLFEDINFISVGFGDDNNFYQDRVLLSLNDQSAFSIRVFASETIPNRGISFNDEQGKRRYYYIRFSGVDGSVSLTEFQNNPSR